jgi:hypothetical protein
MDRGTARGSVGAKPEKPMIGWREWVGLPELGVARVKAKIDTGARTSAIHAFDIESYRRGGTPWVRFELHPLQRNNELRVRCDAPVLDERVVRSSTGHAERRFVIATALLLGELSWPIEISLAQRDEMGFRMLIGRTAIARRVLVDPGRSFLCRAKVKRARKPGGEDRT